MKQPYRIYMLAFKESKRKELPLPSVIPINHYRSPTNIVRESALMDLFSLKFTDLSSKK